jgi:hypothetical protein
MKIILCVFTLAIVSGCGPYEFRSIPMSKKTRRMVNEIAKKNTLDAASVGIVGGRSEQFKNFMILSKKATKEEIIGLTNHPNGVVRAYAMWAIVADTTINPIPILSKHLHDYEKIKYREDCEGWKETVGTMMFEKTISRYQSLPGNKKVNRVLYQIDSMLLSSKTELSVRKDAISRLVANENNYALIRQISKLEYNQKFIELLASYQKEEDVDFLLSYIKLHKDNDYTLCKMIEIFPHELFFPYVLELSDKHIETKGKICLQENCLLALASYRNNKAKEIFTKLLDTSNSEKVYDIFYFRNVNTALATYYTPLYNDNVWQLWNQYKNIDENLFSVLWSQDSIRAISSIKIILLSDKVDRYLAREILGLYIEKMFNIDTNFALDIIKNKVLTADFISFEYYLPFIADVPIPSIIEALLQRIEYEQNAYVNIAAISTLLQYNQKEIYDRIIAIRERNTALSKDWGGKRIDELLQQYKN